MDKNTSPSVQSTEAPPSPLDHGPASDHLLVMFVELLNNGGGGLSLTVHVHGGVITGTLIGGREYYSALAALVQNTNAEDGSGSRLADFLLKESGEIYPTVSNDDGLIPAYIHMKNARYITGNVTMPQQGGFLWRGRLSTVSGFALGSLGK